MNRPRTRLLVDGGDPQETRKIKDRLGFVDGQTTNPTLIANNPEIKKLLASGHRLSEKEQLDEYRKIVREISPLVGSAGVSIEVFSDRSRDARAGYIDCPVFDRAQMIPGDTIEGPAIIEQMDTTTVIPPEFKARVDAALNLYMTL